MRMLLRRLQPLQRREGCRRSPTAAVDLEGEPQAAGVPGSGGRPPRSRPPHPSRPRCLAARGRSRHGDHLATLPGMTARGKWGHALEHGSGRYWERGGGRERPLRQRRPRQSPRREGGGGGGKAVSCMSLERPQAGQEQPLPHVCGWAGGGQAGRWRQRRRRRRRGQCRVGDCTAFTAPVARPPHATPVQS